MIVPAVISRFWSRDLTAMITIATVAGILSGYFGLLLSFQSGLAAGPAIILVAGILYSGSVLFGPCGGLLRPLLRRRQVEA
jgi:zinc/manganese transport system permease protein